MTIQADIISEIYRKYLDREVDPDGLRHFEQYKCSSDVERAIVGSEEFKLNDLILREPITKVAWKVCIIEEAKLIFVPIAKNAHTSLMYSFLEFKGIIPEDLSFKRSDEEILHNLLESHNTGMLIKDFSPMLVNNFLGSGEYLKVTVFRNPVERFLSAFNHFFIQEFNSPRELRHSQKIFNEYGIDSKKNYEPNEWVRRLIKSIMRTKTCDLDPHWAPQYDYISRIKIDHILPIERLDLLTTIVETRSGKNFHIGHHNVRNSKLSNVLIENDTLELIKEFYWLDEKLYDESKNNTELISQGFKLMKGHA